MADAYLSGKQGSVMIGASSFSFQEWTAAMRINTAKITNFTSNGFQAILGCIVDCKISIDGPYNAGNMPFVVGTIYTFILGYSSTVNLTISAMVVGITPTVNVDKEQRIKIEAESSGTFTASIT